MPAIDTEASIRINAPIETVQSALTDFESWPTWSPWLYTEPGAEVTCRGERGTIGHGYDWTGERVGAGSMELRSIERHRLEMDLTFLKPFRSTADVSFDLTESDGSTDVAWGMRSRLPFFLFFMTGTMTAMIKADYERGLRMLKDLIETGKVPSHTASAVLIDVPEAHYIGHSDNTSMSALGNALPRSFGIAASAMKTAGLEASGQPFAVYHSLDLKKGSCRYTAALPLARPMTSSNGIEPPARADSRPACRALKFVHTGAYRHTPNAWSTLHAELRATRKKAAKGIPPFEIYTNDPEITPESDLITEIYMPLRS